MKRFIIIILCLALLCACSAQSNSDESRAAILDENYLIGLNPSELGLQFAPTDDMPFALSPSDEKLKENGEELAHEQSFTFNTVPKVRVYPTNIMSYLGCMQAVFVRMENLKIASKMDGIYVLNFQLFDSDDFKEGMYAKIYKMDVPFEELEKRVFYNDTGFVAVDLTDYMLGNAQSAPITLEDNMAERWPNGHPDEKFALSIRDYVKDNLSSLLHE